MGNLIITKGCGNNIFIRNGLRKIAFGYRTSYGTQRAKYHLDAKAENFDHACVIAKEYGGKEVKFKIPIP